MTRVTLVTGATGFVGRHVLRHLIECGEAVRVVVRRGASNRVQDSAWIERVILSEDIFQESEAWWRDCCEGVDTVLHLAWYAEPGRYLQATENVACLKGTLELARGAVAAGVRRIVGVGTCFEYDLEAGSPRGHFSVRTPLGPTTTYAACKASAFMTLSQWLRAVDTEFLWCRLFYLHGEGEDSRRFVPYLRAQLGAGRPAELTSGVQVRDFLDVNVAACALVQAARSASQGAYNVCSGKGITVREFAERIADEYGRRDLLRFGSRPDNLVDPPCVVGIQGQL